MTLEELLALQQEPLQVPQLPQAPNPLLMSLAQAAQSRGMVNPDAFRALARQQRDQALDKQRLFDFQQGLAQEKQAIANAFAQRQLMGHEEMRPLQMESLRSNIDFQRAAPQRALEAALYQSMLQKQRDEEAFSRQDLQTRSAERRQERSLRGTEERAAASQRATAQESELRAQRDFVRDLLKSTAQGIDPKKYALAQEAVALAQAQGASPEQIQEIAAGFGFEFVGAQPSAARSLLSQFGIVGPVGTPDVLLRPRGNALQQVLRGAGDLPEAMKQVMGLVPGKGAAPPTAVTRHTAPATDRVVVEKDGKRFSLPRAQLPQALKQGYQQVE